MCVLNSLFVYKEYMIFILYVYTIKIKIYTYKINNKTLTLYKQCTNIELQLKGSVLFYEKQLHFGIMCETGGRK